MNALVSHFLNIFMNFLLFLQTFNVDVTGVDLSVNMSHLAYELLDKIKLKNVS